MRYYLHDSNAFQDEKITELFNAHGYEGLGLFYTLLEKLAAQEKPIKISVLKTQLGVRKKLEKVWSFLLDVQLIYVENDQVFNKRMGNYIENYKEKKENIKNRVTKHRETEVLIESVTGYNDVTDALRNAHNINNVSINTNVLSETDVNATAGAVVETIKKLTPKKEKKLPPHWRMMVAAWKDYYLENYKRPSSFTKVDAAHLKSILNRLQKMSSDMDAKKEWDEKYSRKVFTAFLDLARTDNWLNTFFLLPNLSSKFDAIINLKQKKNGTAIKPSHSEVGKQITFDKL